MAQCVLKSLLSFFVLFLSTSLVSADVVIQVATFTATPGSRINVTVSGSSASGASIGSIDVPFDFGGDGVGLPNGLTYLGVTDIAGFDFGGIVGTGPSSEEDELASGLSGNGIPLSVDPLNGTPLFNLEFLIDGSVEIGTVFTLGILADQSFSGDASVFSVLDSSFANIQSSAVTGGISIRAIPEPNSIFIAVGCFICLTVRRHRISSCSVL